MSALTGLAGRVWLFAVIALALASVPAHAAVKAWLDSSQVGPGDSVGLTLEYEGQTSSDPDLSPLERDFDVLGSNRETTVEIVNGSASAKTQVVVTLSPKHGGRLIVPPLVWGGERTPALTIDVSGSAGAGGAGVQSGSAGLQSGGAQSGGARAGSAASRGREVFLETEFSPAQPYVQAAVGVTLRLYTREALYNPSVSFDSTRDMVVRQIGSDENSTVTRGGESYAVVTRHYVVFPQRSGELTVPGPVLNAQVAVGSPAGAAPSDPFAGFFGPTPFVGNVISSVKPIRLHADPITLDVRPRPAGAGGSYWMPASDVTLRGVWDPSALQAKAGDPVTVDLSLDAVGLTAAQLPDLSQLLELPAGLKAYPDQARLSDAASGATVVGTRSQSIALIADQPGDFIIPALTLKWWDTRTNQPREVTLPARTLVVTPAPGTAVSTQTAQGQPAGQVPMIAAAAGTLGSPGTPASASGAQGASGASMASAGSLGRHFLGESGAVWLWVSGALGLAWLATLGAWLRLRWRTARGSAAVWAPARERAAAQERVSAGVSAARAAFRLACQRDDASGARRHLLAWVRATSPEWAPSGLNALARQIDDPELAARIRDLDRACYTGEPWRGEALGAALSELPRPKRDRGSSSSGLAPLYP